MLLNPRIPSRNRWTIQTCICLFALTSNSHLATFAHNSESESVRCMIASPTHSVAWGLLMPFELEQQRQLPMTTRCHGSCSGHIEAALVAEARPGVRVWQLWQAAAPLLAATWLPEPPCIRGPPKQTLGQHPLASPSSRHRLPRCFGQILHRSQRRIPIRKGRAVNKIPSRNSTPGCVFNFYL